jgi:hypothetical protein
MHLRSVERTEGPKDEFLDGVRRMAAGDYEVFGEIGRGENSTIVYLARDIAAFRLVALKLTPSRMEPDEFLLDVVQELDSTLPSFDNPCGKCGTNLHKWGRFCPKCGADLYDKAEQKWTADELREAVQDFATDRFEILGEMRTQGGGRIYFARDVTSGKVEALRLKKQSGDEFSLGFTGILKPVVASVVGTDRPSLGRTGPYPKIDRQPVEAPKPAPVSLSQPPTPTRPAPPMARPVQSPRLPDDASPLRRPRHPRESSADQDTWAPLRDFIQHPVVLTVLLACLVLVLLILLALVT